MHENGVKLYGYQGDKTPTYAAAIHHGNNGNYDGKDQQQTPQDYAATVWVSCLTKFFKQASPTMEKFVEKYRRLFDKLKQKPTTPPPEKIPKPETRARKRCKRHCILVEPCCQPNRVGQLQAREFSCEPRGSYRPAWQRHKA